MLLLYGGFSQNTYKIIEIPITNADVPLLPRSFVCFLAFTCGFNKFCIAFTETFSDFFLARIFVSFRCFSFPHSKESRKYRKTNSLSRYNYFFLFFRTKLNN